MESVGKYRPMFNAFAVDGKMPDWVDQTIRDTEALFKREDRVVWVLRWERYMHAVLLSNAELQAKFERGIPAGVNVTGAFTTYREIANFKNTFKHFFSLPIPQFNNVVWNNQSPDELVKIFTDIEKEWTASRAQIVNHSAYPPRDYNDDDDDVDDDDADENNNDPGIENVLDFGNGWAWWNLNRKYCKVEGGAMGHCGNAAAAKKGDTILSLRKHIRGDEYRPSLTFILHDDDYLGEMKGRANEKPKPEYHGMIVALLKSGLVKGIRGGGYASNRNFTILDLPIETRDALLAENPDLLSSHDAVALWEMEPTDKHYDLMTEKVHEAVGNMRFLKIINDDKNNLEVIINEWSDREEFARRNHCYPLERVHDFLYADLENILEEHYNIDENTASEIAKRVFDDYYDDLFDCLSPYMYTFKLSGVYLQALPDGKVQTRIQIRNILEPELTRYEGMAWEEEVENEPAFDQISSLDDEEEDEDSYNSFSSMTFNDVRGLADHLDELGAMLAEFFFEGEPEKDFRKVINSIIQVYDSDNSDIPYFSRDPNQHAFDWYNETQPKKDDYD